MPCESCHVQFTVFRRKRSCYECKRFYCSSCLTTTKRNLVFCHRCSIFAKRPLLRADLLQLKPKDLIFFLQSKHISTAGCVEKEELVSLVLSHIAQADGVNSPNVASSPGDEHSNSFDSLKQTCQNFFTNITDNINDSFATFEAKASSKSAPARRSYSQPRSRESSTDYGSSHIYEQPRVSTRVIPTYASFQSSQTAQTTSLPTQSPTAVNYDTVNITISNSSSCHTVSPEVSPSTSTSPPQPQSESFPKPLNINNTADATARSHIADKSDCDCSDDEIIATYSERLSVKTENSGQTNISKRQIEPSSACLGASTSNTSAGFSKQGSLSSKVDICGADESSQSSFEELGAIGGISDDSKAATDTNSSSNIEQWQLLDVQKLETTNEEVPEVTNELTATENLLQVVATIPTALQTPIVPQRTKKVVRRRSEGYLNRRRLSSGDESPTGNVSNLQTLGEQPEEQISRRSSCQRCGKNKTNIRRHVEKMRRHLESSQMSEEDIKRELQEFLAYLEQRTKSIDISDTESRAVSSLSGGGVGVRSTPTAIISPTSESVPLDDNDGIHVYAAPSSYPAIESRFINLDDFETFKDLESLTVKQLKEVLMLHRVDYKGCCEKQELLDRVERLWKNLRSTPAIEKLPTDELCKICMDAPIECVILECGHMATCTNCGKVLSECPICRQYIVRVVRFFRA